MMESIKTDEFRKKIIDEINLVRKEPQNYADKIRKYLEFFKGKILKIPESIPIMTTEGPQAFEEAAFFLDNSDAQPALKYSPGLTHAAHEALLDIQKSEDAEGIDEMNIDTYIEKHGQVIGHFAQAIDFGSSLPELVVVNLLVDDGDSSRANRENIMDPHFKLLGVASGAHSLYHRCSVLMYARHFYSIGEIPGDLSDDNYDSIEDKQKAQATLLNKNKNEENKIDQDMDLPEGLVKIDKQEKIISENGVQKKIIKITKHLENGDIETEIYKEKI
jgi:hypothetical protein